MSRNWLRFLILIALATSIALSTAAVAIAQQSNAYRDATQDGPLGDFYKIPVDDPETTSILGWLSKPKGPGPFPAVVLFPPCGGIQNSQLRMFSRIIEGLGAKAFATLVIDPYAPRHIEGGVVCATPQRFNMPRAGADSYAALNFLVTMPEIDSKHVFLEGFSHGGTAAIDAIQVSIAAQQRRKFAGAIGYYPHCRADAKFSVPTLILIGDNDDWTPVDLCRSIKEKRNVELVVYPGVTHAFNQPGVRDVLGHRLVYDEASTADAQSRAEAFLTAHLRR